MIPKRKQDPKQKRTRPIGRLRLRPPKDMSRKEARNLTARVKGRA